MPADSLPRAPQELVLAYQQALVRLDEQADGRWRAEETLGEGRERLQLALEASNLVLWDFKAPFKRLFLTAKWGDILGEVTLGGFWETVRLRSRVRQGDLDAIRRGIGELRAGHKGRGVVEFRYQAKGGWVWIEAHGMVAQRDARGNVTRLIGTLADISERKAHEQKLIRAMELADKANRAKTEFLTNISHEIRTPLNALMGLNALLLDTPLTDDQRHWLELMSGSSQSLLKLLNDMLDLSRIEAGKLVLESVPFELRPFLEATCALYMEQGRAKSISFVQRFAPDLPSMILGDQGRLGQVLSNLLSNAVKFTDEGGEVVLDAAVDGVGEAARLVFTVQDTGIGIRQEAIANLFHSFTQADASIAGRYGGSGMGLAICSSLVDLMGGRIGVDSQVGLGSRFRVNVPLLLPDQQTIGAPSPPPVALACDSFDGWRVLLAEDHAVNELVVSQMLSKFGCEVAVARNGHEAVDLWKGGGFDLILMDVQMPGCNGLVASRRIREIEAAKKLPRVPIVALTASAMNGDEGRCLAAGMDAYVVKPVKMASLTEAMCSVRRGLTPRLLTGAERAAASADPAELRPEQEPDCDLAGISSMIVADLQDRMVELDQALVSKNARQALGATHKLKATLGLLESERGGRICRGLEMAANAGEWNLFSRVLPLMRAEVQRLLPRNGCLSLVTAQGLLEIPGRRT